MHLHPRALVCLLLLASAAPVRAQEPVDLDAIGRLRAEGYERSQVMDTVQALTDRYGPRLTNSPQQRAAAAWAVERMTEFGLSAARTEAWGEFGLGWSNERCVVEMCSPVYMNLIACPKAWTRGTDGVVSGVPLLIEAEKPEDLEQYAGRLAGRIVLAGKIGSPETPWEPLARRHDDESLAELVAVDLPGDGGGDPDRARRIAEWRARRAVQTELRKMLDEEGAAVVLEPDGGRRGDYGVITLGSGGSRDPEDERAICQVVVATEQWNRIARLVQAGDAPEMCVEVSSTFHDDDLRGYNVLAEIPGTDPLIGHEVVMLGGHFDSWHPATGATDNGASCAVAMEAARLIVAAGLAPRRTIRVALWTGEEQGLLGSSAYVKQHFADADTMLLAPEHHALAAYFNMDNGAGALRGIYCQENAVLRPIFEAWIEPLRDLGVETVTYKNTGSTDHVPFDRVGLPGFQFIQDPMDYGTRTHHTNMDYFERVHRGDVMQASVVMASFAWHAANRDERLPRKPLPEARKKPEPTPAPEAKVEVDAPDARPATHQDD